MAVVALKKGNVELGRQIMYAEPGEVLVAFSPGDPNLPRTNYLVGGTKNNNKLNEYLEKEAIDVRPNWYHGKVWGKDTTLTIDGTPYRYSRLAPFDVECQTLISHWDVRHRRRLWELFDSTSGEAAMYALANLFISDPQITSEGRRG